MTNSKKCEINSKEKLYFLPKTHLRRKCRFLKTDFSNFLFFLQGCLMQNPSVNILWTFNIQDVTFLLLFLAFAKNMPDFGFWGGWKSYTSQANNIPDQICLTLNYSLKKFDEIETTLNIFFYLCSIWVHVWQGQIYFWLYKHNFCFNLYQYIIKPLKTVYFRCNPNEINFVKPIEGLSSFPM